MSSTFIGLVQPSSRTTYRVSLPMPAAFAMIMLTTTASGDAYTFGSLSEMHTRAGFKDITKHPIPMSPHTIVMARA